MLIFSAIDLYGGKAVRLYKGDYQNMTVYSDDPVAIARDFVAQGATCIHMVDLEGARDGTAPNLSIVRRIAEETPLFTEIGGGIRSMETVRTYLEAGLDRVILGTAAVTDPNFLRAALDAYGDRIAVGVDIKDGKVAIKGWLETAEDDALTFCEKMVKMGVKTIISTDISKDGAMQGANHELYRTLADRFDLQIVASGGVSSIEDVRRLRSLDLYGAIIGKAYYIGAISLSDAIKEAT